MGSDRSSNGTGCTAGTCINVTETAHHVTGSDKGGGCFECVVGQVVIVSDVESDCID